MTLRFAIFALIQKYDSMNEIITKRIALLREWMGKNELSAFIIPSSDPHLSEYVSECWKSRQWISGFTGSAGTIVITLKSAGLWTDSRYFLQAEKELKETGISLYKMGLAETPSFEIWLTEELNTGDKVGIDGKMISIFAVGNIINHIKSKGLILSSDKDPFEEIWENRPGIPLDKAFIYDSKYAGVSALEKINEARKHLDDHHVEAIIISALDEIAWLLNIRGNDVKDTPVVISYFILTHSDAELFINSRKISSEIDNYLKSLHINVCEYDELDNFLAKKHFSSVLIDPQKTNYHILQSLPISCRTIKESSHISLLKAIRNATEVSGLRNAMIKDGIALVRFQIWLEKNVSSGNETEISIDEQLHELRSQQEMFVGESFDTIAGYKEHAAIVHYSATPETNAKLKPEGSILIDSGAQYLDGTTDITRTICLGSISEEEKIDYTLVLKGNINLAMAKFPKGTRGTQLDILARAPMWSRGINYLHGTGHGVGHFLSVHEGPQAVRMNDVPVCLVPGMTCSDEPGIYKKNKHGVRIENMLLVCTDISSEEFGEFYRFETMTLCPIDTAPIIRTMLNQEQIKWINNYHQTVYEKLSPHLAPDEARWLREKTTYI